MDKILLTLVLSVILFIAAFNMRKIDGDGRLRNIIVYSLLLLASFTILMLYLLIDNMSIAKIMTP